MSWFKKLLGIVSGEDAKDFLFVPALVNPSVAAAAISPDEVYVQLFIDSLRIDKARAFATRFHGAVYSYAALAKLGEGDATFAAVTKPDKLTELDKDSVDKVISISKMMMGPVPWRGGSLELQLGLFSVKSGNVLTPVLNFVTKVSDAAGIALIGVAKPFLPLIEEGMDLIAGQTDDTRLLVGIDTAMQLDKTMTCAIIAKQKHQIDATALSIDPTDGKLLLNGVPLDAAYCVFSIRATDRKADFGAIPELKEGYAAFRGLVVAGKEQDAREACNAFCRLALTSPDLISKDASRLAGMVRQMLADAFGPETAPAIRDRGESSGVKAPAALPGELAEFALY